MRVFARRSPSFSDVERVAVAFQNEDSRARLMKASSGMGLLAVVGLSHEPTPSSERGRLLGLVEFAPVPVALSELLDVDEELSGVSVVRDPPSGPHAVPVLRAWSFDAPLMRASDAFQDPLGIDPTERVVELTRAEADLVCLLPKTEVQAPYETLRRQSYALAKSLQSATPTTGPKPVGWTAEVTHDPNSDAWTYLMRFGERKVWKIGHTQDIERRLEELNLHVPHEALKERWALVRSKHWHTSVRAYEMEQAILLAFTSYRTIGERMECEEEVLLAAWENLVDRSGKGSA